MPREVSQRVSDVPNCRMVSACYDVNYNADVLAATSQAQAPMAETHSGFGFSTELQTMPAYPVKTSEQPPECGLSEWLPKAWGRTRTIYRDPTIEIIECEIKAGGHSSEHLHRFKNNEFRVIWGRLKVEYESVHSPRTLGIGNTMAVFAGTRHSFVALEETRLIEIYTSADGSLIDPEDIERFSTGGLRE